MKDKRSQLKIQVRKNPKGFLVLVSSKKGQLKIQEMAFMLVAVIIFFSLVGLFMISIYQTNLAKEVNQIRKDNAIVSISNLASSAEFSCSGSRTNCVDEDKLIALANSSAYKNYWEFTSLRVLKISALKNVTKEKSWILCTNQNYPNCDVHVLYTESSKNITKIDTIGSYVSLCRKELKSSYTYEKCELAKIWAGVKKA